MRYPRNQLLENSPTCHLQRIRINATRFEETRIHFKSDVLLAPSWFMLNFHNIYETLWSVRNRIFSVQIGMVLLIASERFPESSVIHSFLVSKVENESFPCTRNVRTYVNEPDQYNNIVRRDNSSRVRTHEKSQAMLFAGCAQKYKAFFVPNQEPAFAWLFGNGPVRVGTQGIFRPFLKTFVGPFLSTRLTTPGSPRMSKRGREILKNPAMWSLPDSSNDLAPKQGWIFVAG